MNAKSANSSIQSFSLSDFASALAEHNYEFNVGQIVTGKVVSHETRGAYVDIGGKSPGFLPIEEVSLSSADTPNLVELLPLETERSFLIISDQDADGGVKLSIRRLQVRQAWENLRSFQAEAKAFDCRVVGTNKGGVMVNCTGLRGFIPRSHLVEKSDLAGLVGKTLAVVIEDLDESRNKLVLSNRKAMRASAMSQLSRGQLIEGKVSSLRPFGAFVDFGGTSGLLHIKEISQKYIGDINSVFQPDQAIKAVIVDIDESRNRISLSTKILENHAGEMLDNREQVFAEAEQRLENNIKQLWD